MNTAFGYGVAGSLHWFWCYAQQPVPKATKKAFKHRIVIVSPQTEIAPIKARQHSSIKWKQKALYSTKRKFYFQVLKADTRLRRNWWNNYYITRIGAPQPGEFLCRETFYVAKMSEQADAIKFKTYWYWCKKRSLEILEWLWALPPEEYCWKLHIYLRGLIVTKPAILSEIQRYDSKTEDEIVLQIFGNRGGAFH